MEKLILASYGDDIEIEPHKLTKIMIVDDCFLLELLIRLEDFMCSQNNENNNRKHLDDRIIGNHEKMVSVLNDITMLLKKLYRKVFPDGSDINNDHRVANIVRRAFGYPEVDNSAGVHILHLMHLSTVEQSWQEAKLVKKELLRCATRLRAAGIKTISGNTPIRHDLVDWFNFDISFHDRKLRIPPLYIKGTTEVRWRNLIAWEQSKIWSRYKYTSYALFFQGLVCCKHDIELLEEEGRGYSEQGRERTVKSVSHNFQRS